VSGSAGALLSLLPSGELLAPVAAVRDLLAVWDGRMDAGSREAGIFAAWRNALVQAVSAHPALVALHAPHGFGAVFDPWMGIEGQVAAALPRLLRHRLLSADAGEMIEVALGQAVEALSWGATHRMLPLHVLADVPGITPPGAEFDAGLSGDGDAVRCTGSTPGLTDRSWRGSVARWAWDLADREASLWSVPFGASGDPDSPHFADQFGGWVDVRPVPVVTDWRRLTIDHPTGAA